VPSSLKSTSCSAVQGQPVLLVADSRAFFTLYKVITNAGFRAHQLDREGRLQQQQPGPGPAGQPAAAVGSTGAAVVEAVAKALDAANCILLSKQQLCLASFPLARFTCMVELCRLDLVETRPDLEDQVTSLLLSQIAGQHTRGLNCQPQAAKCTLYCQCAPCDVSVSLLMNLKHACVVPNLLFRQCRCASTSRAGATSWTWSSQTWRL
jgi:hypothetical protein